MTTKFYDLEAKHRSSVPNGMQMNLEQEQKASLISTMKLLHKNSFLTYILYLYTLPFNYKKYKVAEINLKSSIFTLTQQPWDTVPVFITILVLLHSLQENWRLISYFLSRWTLSKEPHDTDMFPRSALTS